MTEGLICVTSNKICISHDEKGNAVVVVEHSDLKYYICKWGLYWLCRDFKMASALRKALDDIIYSSRSNEKKKKKGNKENSIYTGIHLAHSNTCIHAHVHINRYM